MDWLLEVFSSMSDFILFLAESIYSFEEVEDRMVYVRECGGEVSLSSEYVEYGWDLPYVYFIWPKPYSLTMNLNSPLFRYDFVSFYTERDCVNPVFREEDVFRELSIKLLHRELAEGVFTGYEVGIREESDGWYCGLIYHVMSDMVDEELSLSAPKEELKKFLSWWFKQYFDGVLAPVCKVYDSVFRTNSVGEVEWVKRYLMKRLLEG